MRLRVGAVCALILAAPFEPRLPIFIMAGQSVTLTEFIWSGAALCWALSWVRERRWPAWRTPMSGLLLAWLAVMGVAALTANAEGANAVKASARLVMMVATAWIVASSVTRLDHLTTVQMLVGASGLIVTALAAAEVYHVGAAEPVLAWFRAFVRVVGGDVRASGSLQYPTIAAAYLTWVLCLAAGLCLQYTQRSQWAPAVLAGGVVATVAVGVSWTLTRGAVAAALCGLTMTAWALMRVRSPRRVLAGVAVCMVCVVAAPLAAAATDLGWVRWSRAGRADWYRASFEAPPVISARPGALITVPVTVVNQGRRTWTPEGPPPFHLSYHVLEAAGPAVVQYDGVRTPLPHPVAPGATLTTTMTLRVPPTAGPYRIAWDVVQEHRLWFGSEPGAVPAFSSMEVSGELAHDPVDHPRPPRGPAVLPVPRAPAGRLELWRAAVTMAAGAPLFGAGPDNFRLTSAPYLRSAEPDPRVHSNNMYLEVLTGGGVFALGTFVWVVVRVARVAREQFVRLAPAPRAAYAGVCAAAVAWLVHGLLDSFLTFTPTLIATGVLLGLIAAPMWWPSDGKDAACP